MLVANEQCRHIVRDLFEDVAEALDNATRGTSNAADLRGHLRIAKNELRDAYVQYPTERGLILASEVVFSLEVSLSIISADYPQKWTETIDGADAWNAFVTRHFAAQ